MMFLAKINETEQLIDLIHEQNSNYIGIMLWIFGVMVTVFVAFFGVQWYLNTKQVKTIKRETEQEILEKYITPLKTEVDDSSIWIKSEYLRKELDTSLKYIGQFNEQDIEESLYNDFKNYLDKLSDLSTDKNIKRGILATAAVDVRNKIQELNDSKTTGPGLEYVKTLYAEIKKQIDDQK